MFGRNTLAGLRHYPGGFMRLLSQMHSSFRGVSGSLSVRSSSSFYLLASPIPLRLFLSCPLPPAFAELSAFYFTQHARTLHTMLTLALIRVLRLSLLFLHVSSATQQ